MRREEWNRMGLGGKGLEGKGGTGWEGRKT